MKGRNQLIAKVKIGCKQLPGLDDSRTYKAMLHGQTGKTSCGKMSIAELEKVVKHLESRGAVFTNKGNKRKHKAAADPQVRKVYALWTELYEAGKIKDPSRDALRAWVMRMTKDDEHPNGVGDPDWLTGKQLTQCIESLKQWLAR